MTAVWLLAKSSARATRDTFEEGGNKLTDLFFSRRWANDTLVKLLNTEGSQQRKVLIDTWVESTLESLGTIGVTAALVAGVISSAFSWYDVSDTCWFVKASWYSGLVFALTSISAATLNGGVLLRVRCHTDATERYRAILGKAKPTVHDPSETVWEPHLLQSWIWGVPGFLLKLALMGFLFGLAVHVWWAARRMDYSWASDELKIAFIATLAACFALLNYILCVVHLFFPTASTQTALPK